MGYIPPLPPVAHANDDVVRLAQALTKAVRDSSVSTEQAIHNVRTAFAASGSSSTNKHTDVARRAITDGHRAIDL